MLSSIQLGSGPLWVYDLYELQLSADLVTLSGCGTGLNAVVGGDELLGLVRGLLYAGARALLLTLWDAHDRSTAEFMASFYEHLSAGQGKAGALQAAMLELRTRYRHPFYWAPFTLIGDVLTRNGRNSAPSYISREPRNPL
jgi:CHAT domain-containing protein